MTEATTATHAEPDTLASSSVEQRRRSGKAALKDLLRPVSKHIMVGRILAGASGIIAIAPYIALVELGTLLLRAHDSGQAPDGDEVGTVTRWLIGSFVLQLMTYAIALLITHAADLRLSEILRTRIITRVSHAPLSWFSSTTSGRIRKAIQDDTKTVHSLVAHAPVETTAAVVTPLALAVYAFVVDWRLGLLAIATLPVFLGVQAWGMRGMSSKTTEMDERLGRVSSTAVEFADGIAVVKAFGQVGKAHARFSRAAREFADFYHAWVGPMLRQAAVASSFISVPIMVLINMGVGSLLVRGGHVEPVDVLTTTLIALVLPATVQVVSKSAWSYQLAGGAALRIAESLSAQTLPPAREAHSPASHQVEFEDVGFSYGTNRALDGVSAVLRPGTVTALVGQSGSGKSTLATMLARFQDPDQGAVRVGGVDLRDMEAQELYRAVSFVLQDPQLLRVSLRDNIRLARPDADDAQVMAAARAANIDQEIEALPDGLDTIFDEGTSLSGGQAQRVAIARAILADTPILILDEALTATDADAEAQIQAALNVLVVGRTVLVIAHRPEAVRGVDQVLCMRQGAVVARLDGSEVTDAALEGLMAWGAQHD